MSAVSGMLRRFSEAWKRLDRRLAAGVRSLVQRIASDTKSLFSIVRLPGASAAGRFLPWGRRRNRGEHE